MSRAFTLIELLVSTVLMSLMVLFFYKAVENFSLTNDHALEAVKKAIQRDRLYQLLFRDLVQAERIDIEPLPNRHYTILRLRTTNSLHQVSRPYVAYFVHAEGRRLVRLESAYPFTLPVDAEQIERIFAEPLVEGVRRFIVERHKREYLLYLAWQEEQLMIDLKKE